MNNLPFVRHLTDQDKPDEPKSTSGSSVGVKTAGGHPEKEPSGGYLEEIGKPPELEKTVEAAGVKHVEGEIKLSADDKKAGITESAETTPVSLQPSGAPSLSFTDDQLKKALRHKITESILWLATWWLRKLQMAHRKLNKISSNT